MDLRYDLIVDRLLKGRVIPFLGAGVNLCGRSLDGEWHPGAGVLPSGWELSKYLATKFKYPGDLKLLDLLHISQFVEIDQTEGTLYDELHELFNVDFPPTPVHQFLASFPAMRRRKGLKDRYQTILTTNYDDVLERAFLEACEPFDVVFYDARAKSPNFGMFWHRSSDRTIDQLIASPNVYSGLQGDRTVILKIHGAVERGKDSGTSDSYVISEDDYIDYMAHERALDRFPIPIKEKLKESSFLFLGYGLRDWNMRILLRRIWQDQPLDQQSWAVAKGIDRVDQLFWSKRNVTIIDTDLADFVRDLREKIEPTTPTGGTP
jgi:hypothetical protein